MKIPDPQLHSRLEPAGNDVETAAQSREQQATHKVKIHSRSADKPPEARGRVLVFAGLFVMITASSSLYSLLAPFFPMQAEEKGVSTMLTGVIFAVFALVVFVTSPLFGVHMAAIGQRRLMFAGLIFLSVSTILFGFMHYVKGGVPFIVFCFTLRCFQGLGAAAVETSAYAITANLFPDAISYMMGLLEVACGMGLMIGPPVGGILYGHDPLGRSMPFLVVGCLPLPCLALFSVLLPPNLGLLQEHGSMKALWDTLSLHAVKVVLVIAMVGEGSLAFLEPVLEPHMRVLSSESPAIAALGGGHVFIGLLFCTVSVHYALAVPLAGWAARPRRLGSHAIMTLGLLACAIAFLLTGPSPMFPSMGSSPTIMLAACAMGVLGVGQGLSIVPNMEALLHATSSSAAEGGNGEAQHDFHDSASVNIMAGLLNGAYSFGSMVAPISGSFMVERMGMPWACTVWSGVLFVTALATGVPWSKILPASWVRCGCLQAGPIGDSTAAGGMKWRRSLRKYAFPVVGALAVVVLLFWVSNLEQLMQRSGAFESSSDELVSTEMSTDVDALDDTDARRKFQLF